MKVAYCTASPNGKYRLYISHRSGRDKEPEGQSRMNPLCHCIRCFDVKRVFWERNVMFSWDSFELAFPICVCCELSLRTRELKDLNVVDIRRVSICSYFSQLQDRLPTTIILCSC